MNISEAIMKTAETFAKLSYSHRKKVGAVLVKDNRILACGYNGTISGLSNVCESYSEYNREPLENERVVDCPDCDKYGMSSCLTCSGKGKIIISETTSEFTLHAEQNVISYCAKNGIPTNGTTMYITLSPCKTCAKLIAQSGIKKVIYKDLYRDTDGIDFLMECGVYVKQIKFDK